VCRYCATVWRLVPDLCQRQPVFLRLASLKCLTLLGVLAVERVVILVVVGSSPISHPTL
jgi:hypothetical protein